MSDENGFKVRIYDVGMFNLYYSNYEVINDTLYEFENEKEHNVFLRKDKLKKINNVFG